MNVGDFIYKAVYKDILNKGHSMNFASQWAALAVDKFKKNKYSMNGGVTKMMKEVVKDAVRSSKK